MNIKKRICGLDTCGWEWRPMVGSCKNRNKPLWKTKNFLTVLLLTSQEGLYFMSGRKPLYYATRRLFFSNYNGNCGFLDRIWRLEKNLPTQICIPQKCQALLCPTANASRTVLWKSQWMTWYIWCLIKDVENCETNIVHQKLILSLLNVTFSHQLL
jgi:hypothetical protein